MDRSPHWTFEFRASGDQLRSNTYSQVINQSIKLPNGTNMTLTNYWENDVSCSIEFSLDHALDGLDVSILGVDENGNFVEFLLDTMTSSEGNFVLNQQQLDTIEPATTLTLKVMSNSLQIGESFVINR